MITAILGHNNFLSVLRLALLTLLLVIVSSIDPAIAQEISPNLNPTKDKESASPQNQIAYITDKGIEPNHLELTPPGSSIFFFNQTASSDVKVQLEYGEKKGFCATGAMKMSDDGIFQSRETFSPKHFVVVCFPEAGKYKVKATGSPKFATGAFAEVIVR